MLRLIINRYVAGFLVLAVLAVVLVNVTGEERTSLTPFEKITKDVMTPLEGGLTRVIKSLSTVRSVFNIGELKAENKTLREQLAAAKSESLLLKEYGYQNLRFRDMLKFKDTVSGQFEMITASVVGRNPSNWYKTITLNRGGSDGVKKNMVVVTNQGVVGHIINVSQYSAEVLLVVESSSAAGALIQVSRIPGVVEGLGDNTGQLKMRYIAKDAPIREKQVIVTSGLGGIFPKGLPIGRIEKIEMESNGLEKYAIVQPFVDFNRIEEVFIIKNVFGETANSLIFGVE